MPFIKELVMKGFKSFARETRIPLKRTMNVIIGPNGSGKSNITDGICFVLGRLGTKSLRASKLSNLIFAGTKKYKPSPEASVELVFDNSDKGFSLQEKDVGIKRIIRKNGQSVYKINDEVKTRQEVIELLAQAGIDPKGFNIVLQGEIERFVKMPPESRRQIIEEVAGISVYELRKEKSLKELEKTDSKLKEVNAVLRERRAYLNNLEQERKQALRFNQLQDTLKKCRASILNKHLSEKKSQINSVNEEISKKQGELDKIRINIGKTESEISSLNEKINDITNRIQRESGIEQERVNSELSDLRAEMAGLTTRKDNYESQISELEERNKELKETTSNLEEEIENLKKTKGKNKKQELDLKKSQLEELDEQKRKFYIIKSQISSLIQILEDKKSQLQKIKNTLEFTLKQIEQVEQELKTKESLEKQEEILRKISHSLIENKENLKILEQEKIERDKTIAVLEKQIEKAEKIKKQVKEVDICPLCQTKITKEHIEEVIKQQEEEIQKANSEISTSKERIHELKANSEKSEKEIKTADSEVSIREQDMQKLHNIDEKKQHLQTLNSEKESLEKEFNDLHQKKKTLENKMISLKISEEKYDSLRLDLQELERQEESSLGMDVTMKQREVERIKLNLKQNQRTLDDLREELESVSSSLEEKTSLIEEKEHIELQLKSKFRKILEDKARLQDKIRLFESHILKKQNEKTLIEQEINEKKITRAQVSAQKDSLEQEFSEFSGLELISMSITLLQEKLEKTQQTINSIGTVNQKALEVYDEVKQEYDSVEQKVQQLGKEKEEILKIIEDIDKKKKKAFFFTLKNINDLFERNFSQLSIKGQAQLSAENSEDVFAAGLDILIKVAKGKYFDVSSLSGGEQTLVALSLIFAIQEFKPYSFYIFDEIDAALDKHNSERLAALLKRYFKSGQYLVITHNDALISESTALFGVSMQEGVSKVLSLEV